MKRIFILVLFATLTACANKKMLVAPPVLAKSASVSTESAPTGAKLKPMQLKSQRDHA
jgi:hypothetical protein